MQINLYNLQLFKFAMFMIDGGLEISLLRSFYPTDCVRTKPRESISSLSQLRGLKFMPLSFVVVDLTRVGAW